MNRLLSSTISLSIVITVMGCDDYLVAVVEKGLNVRQVEALGQEQALAKGKTIGTRARASASKDADTMALEQRLSDALGLVVGIDHRGKGGVLRVRYRTLDQLDDVIRRLESGPSAAAGAPRVRRT